METGWEAAGSSRRLSGSQRRAGGQGRTDGAQSRALSSRSDTLRPGGASGPGTSGWGAPGSMCLRPGTRSWSPSRKQPLEAEWAPAGLTAVPEHSRPILWTESLALAAPRSTQGRILRAPQAARAPAWVPAGPAPLGASFPGVGVPGPQAAAHLRKRQHYVFWAVTAFGTHFLLKEKSPGLCLSRARCGSSTEGSGVRPGGSLGHLGREPHVPEARLPPVVPASRGSPAA